MYKLLPALLLSTLAVHAAAASDWHAIDWHVDSFAGAAPERLALLLPVTINGVACRVQLDTGANGEFIWKRQASPERPLPPQTARVELAGIRKQIAADADSLALLTPEVCQRSVIATVGNAFFEHGTLTLDFKRSRFAFAPQALLANDRDAQPLFYARWTGSGGHTLVEVRRDGAPPGYALLDTGATRFGLAATDAGEWAELSGGAPLAASATVRTFALESWGRTVQCYETDVQGRIVVGGQVLAQTRASYCVDQGFKAPIRLVGVLGLKPLGERVVTLDYLSGRWRFDGQ